MRATGRMVALAGLWLLAGGVLSLAVLLGLVVWVLR